MRSRPARWTREAVATASLLLVAVSARSVPAEDGAADPVDFQRDVRPVLAEHCYGCHGPDEAVREAELRLDRRVDVFADRGGFRVVVPGDPDASEMVARIFDDADPMPPRDEKPLAEAEKLLLRRWIEEGAAWPGHWSFDPPRRALAPDVRAERWVRDPLDRFVLARLEAEGLAPAPEAAPAAWLRRVSFDLIGLPPAPDELDELERDLARGKDVELAYAAAVDRMLASPRYGERRAQDWLDLARYADTNGNQFDEPRTQWKWRDWVIDAFNANMPFDEFAVEQLAGDLLPEPTLSQIVATGFNRNHPTDTDNPAERDEYRTKYVIDRVHTTATAFLGLTLACAQCHDHKYDPLTQEDFYSFYAFFNSVDERDVDYGNPRPRIRVPNPDQAPLLADLTRRVDELKSRLAADDALLDAEQTRWEKATLERLGPAPEWKTVVPVSLFSRNGAWLQPQPDGSILSAGPTPVTDTYELVVQPGKGRIEALRLEVLPDPSHDGKTGRGSDGRFHLTRIEVRSSSLTDASSPPPVVIAEAESDLRQVRDEEQEIFEHQALPGDVATAFANEPFNPDEPGGGFSSGGWCLVNEAMGEAHEAVLIPLEPLELNEASVLRISMHQTSGRPKSLVGRFRWSTTDDARLRALLLPMAGQAWSSLGPFPAADVDAAFATAFEPEADLAKGVDPYKRYTPPEVAKADAAAADRAKPGRKPAADAGEARRKEGGEPAKVAADEDPDDEDGDEDGDEDPGAEDRPDDAGAGPAAAKEPRRLAWEEQRAWKDGARARIAGAGAHYLTRKIVSSAARTAVLRLDGPAGVKVWLNGEEVFADPPKPEQEEQADRDDEVVDFEEMRTDAPVRTARLGFRAGENELVVKAVFPEEKKKQGGPMAAMFGFGRPRGGSLTFDLTPEGDDLLSYEILSALRARAAGAPERVVGAADGPAGVADAAAKAAAAVRADAAAKADAGTAEASATAAMYAADSIPPAPVKPRTRAGVLREHFRTRLSPFGRVLNEELARLKVERAALEREIPEVLVMKDLAVPRRTFVFHRGEFRHPGQEVFPRTPATLPPMADELPRNRLGLARWLASPENPLFARVAVNRIWQEHFGVGLVASAGDFGVRGDLPSHPELLDTLAIDFAESGWDVKALHRRIVLSTTYRQACAASPDALERDPENRLLSRGPRTRLSAEMIRDQALALSGLLVQKLGGKPVKPYQAPGLWSEVTGGKDWKKDDGEAQYRRGVYVYRKRRVPYASMKAFDREGGETCTVARPETITPLQALVTLNNPVYVEAARKLGERILDEGGDDDAARLAFGFRLCTSRAPSADELAVLTELLTSQRAAYTADEKAAKKLLKVGDAKPAEGRAPVEAATWAGVATALLNLDAALHEG